LLKIQHESDLVNKYIKPSLIALSKQAKWFYSYQGRHCLGDIARDAGGNAKLIRVTVGLRKTA